MINTITDGVYHLMDASYLIIALLFPDVQNYPFPPWRDVLKTNTVHLREFMWNNDWNEFFDQISGKNYYEQLETALTQCVQKGLLIVPYPHLVFNIFNLLSPPKIRVVIMGQDPYINTLHCRSKEVPQATGCSFSVPLHCTIPPSLLNIYANMIHHKHLTKVPKSGNLTSWILQGVFLMNASCTTLKNQSNAHQKLWNNFARDWLHYINTKCKNVVFLVWGKNAFEICKLVDTSVHHLIVSSHPSPYSVHNTFRGVDKSGKWCTYPSFTETNHFSLANDYLVRMNKNPIVWDLIDID